MLPSECVHVIKTWHDNGTRLPDRYVVAAPLERNGNWIGIERHSPGGGMRWSAPNLSKLAFQLRRYKHRGSAVRAARQWLSDNGVSAEDYETSEAHTA